MEKAQRGTGTPMYIKERQRPIWWNRWEKHNAEKIYDDFCMLLLDLLQNHKCHVCHQLSSKCNRTETTLMLFNFSSEAYFKREGQFLYLEMIYIIKVEIIWIYRRHNLWPKIVYTCRVIISWGRPQKNRLLLIWGHYGTNYQFNFLKWTLIKHWHWCAQFTNISCFTTQLKQPFHVDILQEYEQLPIVGKMDMRCNHFDTLS